jgi:hypothetical protein
MGGGAQWEGILSRHPDGTKPIMNLDEVEFDDLEESEQNLESPKG